MGLTSIEHIRTEAEAFCPDGAGERPIPFGLKEVDEAMLMGVEPTTPGLNLIQGPMGSRKTTLMINLAANICLSGLLPEDHQIYWWSVDPLMTVERVGLIFECIIASKILLWTHHCGISIDNFSAPFAGCEGTIEMEDYLVRCREVTDMVRHLLSKPLPDRHPKKLIADVRNRYRFEDGSVGDRLELKLKYDLVKRAYMYPRLGGLSPKQQDALNVARWVYACFPIEVYGRSEHGNLQERSQRAFPTTSFGDSVEKWKGLLEKQEANAQVIIDHLTAFYFPDTHSSYEKQLRTIFPIRDLIGEYSVLFWILLQEGIGHQREFDRVGFVRGAEGGDVAGRESDNNWRKTYYGQKQRYYDILHYPVKSRHGVWPDDIAIYIEPESGAYFGSKLKSQL